LLVTCPWPGKPQLTANVTVNIALDTFSFSLRYNSFSNEFTITEFLLPSIIKGLATAVLYSSPVLFTTNKFPLMDILTASGALNITRPFIGGGISAALYGYLFYRQRIGHFNYLAERSDSGYCLLQEKEQKYIFICRNKLF